MTYILVICFVDPNENRPPRVTNLLLDRTVRIRTDTDLIIEWSDPDDDVISPSVTSSSELLTAEPEDLTSTRGVFRWSGVAGKGSIEITLTDSNDNTYVLRLHFQVIDCKNFAMVFSYGK